MHTSSLQRSSALATRHANAGRLPFRASAWFAAVSATVLANLAIGPAAAADGVSCEARSGATRTRVVELYTSEGCSSCPPADRWFSGLSYRPGDASPVLPLAFHVTYWDRLGWADRFASPAHTERQYQLSATRGSKFVYTPQVIVDGTDWRNWPNLPGERAAATPVEVHLRRDGERIVARIGPLGTAPGTDKALTGYWAVIEDGHRTEVRAGENAGTMLRHDHVVRAYQPVERWVANQPKQLSWRPPAAAAGDAASRRRVAFVVVDAASLQPVQAMALEC